MPGTGTRCSQGVDRLHLSGITPALGPVPAQAAIAAAEAAAARDIAVSFDGNWRGKLWERWDGKPREILSRIVAHADLMFGNHRDIALLLDKPFSGDGEDRRREAAEAAFAAFPKLQTIASTARHVEDADRHRLSARIDTRDGHAQTEEITLAGIVDRIGAGDAFAAGVLHALRSRRQHRRRRAHRPGADRAQTFAAGRRQPVPPGRYRRLPRGRAGCPALRSIAAR